MSHDLISPFSAFVSLLDITEERIKTKDWEKIEIHFKSLKASAHKIYSLLENLLNWTRIQMNRVDVKKETLNLKDLIGNVTEFMDYQFYRKKLTFHNDLTGNELIKADAVMIQTIFRNLINNAIKFSDEGGDITINSESSNNQLIINVIDHGCGICESDINKILDKENIYTTTGTRGEMGTGLGIEICQELICLNGGELTVKSIVGSGTTIKLIFPE